MTRKRSLENELNTLCNNKYKGAKIRSKARWVEEGEKNTGYAHMVHIVNLFRLKMMYTVVSDVFIFVLYYFMCRYTCCT